MIEGQHSRRHRWGSFNWIKLCLFCCLSLLRLFTSFALTVTWEACDGLGWLSKWGFPDQLHQHHLGKWFQKANAGTLSQTRWIRELRPCGPASPTPSLPLRHLRPDCTNLPIQKISEIRRLQFTKSTGWTQTNPLTSLRLISYLQIEECGFCDFWFCNSTWLHTHSNVSSTHLCLRVESLASEVRKPWFQISTLPWYLAPPSYVWPLREPWPPRL